MSCGVEEFYDLKLLKAGAQPIDEIIRKVASLNFPKIANLRTPSRIWKTLYDVTPGLVDTFGKEGENHLRQIQAKIDTYGYLYFVAEHGREWYTAPHFDYWNFPLMSRRECVLNRIKKMALGVIPERTSKFDAACLYLLYFYALLANPSLNWITIDYISNGNRYHQHGTRLTGKMKTTIKKTYT